MPYMKWESNEGKNDYSEKKLKLKKRILVTSLCFLIARSSLKLVILRFLQSHLPLFAHSTCIANSSGKNYIEGIKSSRSIGALFVEAGADFIAN